MALRAARITKTKTRITKSIWVSITSKRPVTYVAHPGIAEIGYQADGDDTRQAQSPSHPFQRTTTMRSRTPMRSPKTAIALNPWYYQETISMRVGPSNLVPRSDGMNSIGSFALCTAAA